MSVQLSLVQSVCAMSATLGALSAICPRNTLCSLLSLSAALGRSWLPVAVRRASDLFVSSARGVGLSLSLATLLEADEMAAADFMVHAMPGRCMAKRRNAK